MENKENDIKKFLDTISKLEEKDIRILQYGADLLLMKKEIEKKEALLK